MSVSAIAGWARREFRALLVPFLFFLCGFLLVLLIIKLSLAEYSIEVTTFGRALIGAAVAAKVVLIFDDTPVGRVFAAMPRAVAVIYRTLVYGLGVVVLGLLERVIDEWRHLGSLVPAVRVVGGQMEIHRLMALSLGIALVCAVYFALAEIAAYIGEGAMWELFFKRPAARQAPPPASPEAPYVSRPG